MTSIRSANVLGGRLSARRRGLTLFELMLVLGVVILLTAIAAPSIETWFHFHRLQQGVDTVREHWIKARTLAMEEGRPYRFAYELNGRAYRIGPDEVEVWPELVGSVAGPRQSGIGLPLGLLVEEQLPDGVFFYNLEGELEGRPMLGGWARESIVFWPNGEARLAGPDGQERQETVVILTERSGRMKGLHMRAMTGLVSEQVINSVGNPQAASAY